MTLRLPLSGNKHETIISAYAPTMTNPSEVKDKFYDDLDNIIFVYIYYATPLQDVLGVGKHEYNVTNDQCSSRNTMLLVTSVQESTQQIKFH